MKKLFLLVLVIAYSCEIENIEYLTPIVVTAEPLNVQANTAMLGGSVLAEGGKDVTEFGVVWSTGNTPIITDNKMALGQRLNSFLELISGLKNATTYYYRAYAINEVGVGYGEIYEFTTDAEAACNPIKDNFIDTKTAQINISDVALTFPSYGFDEGNLQFETTSFSSSIKIKVQFNEVNKDFPQTGQYTTIQGDFDGQYNLSNGSAKLYLIDYGIGSQGGATAAPGTVFYVENNGTDLTIIFCDTPLGKPYILNGKFTYPN
ncbi:hypothetical protein Aeqsu_0963 [Aequorivita sublithincola DSM 14238]|uniref:Fibronectin type-III domain-containing protein n=1 Tax=Aequorivita sublithincola (strain DSM 14238 / LMG 21431 / ACAM 643 / 9-3) TaxID=746697 RepID=I3YTZ6_AEQSU|nr:hypothetical protein [Aequorivita sublithincola]AFL80464.1 hypothetical protein Aeqsu_0963 [Aequorivita sublithincola DSM 14238]